MAQVALKRIDESGIFRWPWDSTSGLLVICGASGGGGGGGGAFCLEGLNLFGADGGEGGYGGEPTIVLRKQAAYEAAGGDGGGGGGGGGLHDGESAPGKNGVGCRYGSGGDGGGGGEVTRPEGRLSSNGGDGGKGFPGETLIVELSDLSAGERFDISIGAGGGGGGGGEGYEAGAAGGAGKNGHVHFVPLITDSEGTE